MSDDRFCYSLDEERYHGAYDTREEARDAAVQEFRDQDREFDGAVFVWTARAVKQCAEQFLPDASDLATYVIEHATENASAECGEPAEEWPDIDEADEADLGKRLKAALDGWLADHPDAHPTFWLCEDVKPHEVQPTTPGDAKGAK